MKREGKNTTTLLSIKGFLWEDIKSILIFLSALPVATFQLVVPTPHPSDQQTWASMFYSNRKQRVGNPSEPPMCVQRGGRSWYWNECWFVCAGCMWQIHMPTHLSFLGRLCRWRYFVVPTALTSAKLLCVCACQSFAWKHSCLLSPSSESDGWAYIAESHTP